MKATSLFNEERRTETHETVVCLKMVEFDVELVPAVLRDAFGREIGVEIHKSTVLILRRAPIIGEQVFDPLPDEASLVPRQLQDAQGRYIFQYRKMLHEIDVRQLINQVITALAAREKQRIVLPNPHASGPRRVS